MAKKKQLAGKTTKLAKLPLTQALAEQSEEAGRRPAPDPQVAAGTEPLGALYLHVIRELTAMLAHFQVESASSAPPYQTFLSPHLPKPPELRQSLRRARQGLEDLHHLLSR